MMFRMMKKDDPSLGENLVEIVAGDDGWQDVVLPDGALKSGKLDGLIGFQEIGFIYIAGYQIVGYRISRMGIKLQILILKPK